MVQAFKLIYGRVILRILLLQLFILSGVQCLTTLNSPVEEYRKLNTDSTIFDKEICVKTEVYRRDAAKQPSGVDHYEISDFTSLILQDLKAKGFKRILLLKAEERQFCEILFRYTKVMYSKIIWEPIIIGYPITKFYEIELDAFEYSKDQKLTRRESLKNGYRHYISWLLIPTFFLFYRPSSDEKIIEDFHFRFFNNDKG